MLREEMTVMLTLAVRIRWRMRRRLGYIPSGAATYIGGRDTSRHRSNEQHWPAGQGGQMAHGSSAGICSPSLSDYSSPCVG